MTFEEAIASILKSDSGVSAITTRCYPLTIPQDPTYPLIVYYLIGGKPDNTLTDASGLTHSRVQIDALAPTYASAKTLAEAITDALNAKTYTVSNVKIGSIVKQSERDAYEDEVVAYRIILDFTMWYRT